MRFLAFPDFQRCDIVDVVVWKCFVSAVFVLLCLYKGNEEIHTFGQTTSTRISASIFFDI